MGLSAAICPVTDCKTCCRASRGKFVTTIDYHENDKVALEKLKRIIA